jgi:hypothetical protein
MSYEFQGTLFDTESRWLRAIAQAWLTAGGWNDTADIHAWLDTLPPADLARECISGWWSDEDADAPSPDALAGAFAQLAADREWLL